MTTDEAVRTRVARRLGRDLVLTPSAFIGVAGVWLVVTPVVIDHGVYPWINDVLTGIVLLAVAAAQVALPRRSLLLSGAAALAGAWLAASPYVLGYADQLGVAWNDKLVGALVILLAVVNGLPRAVKLRSIKTP
ncbi:SPW repeat domain-containing protein [Paractinoplanes lichenicola]|uniref:SPW repeat protein n=1 Tax=Paractinoplanes lichenicola TaxID=2802976 RepID=A0ABS1W383_9ACTN|nr:SPW repeat protein [Actinoplanes lichenicola]MBL7261196.1 SPW repeat protein [Actinoplanes lichenicola]